MANVQWVKCKGRWCNLQSVNLSGVDTLGVYAIWQNHIGGKMVRVGQGDIRAKLLDHRHNPEIIRYGGRHGLSVTWASVPSARMRAGIERYLVQQYSPLIVRPTAPVQPIAVNLAG